MEQKHTRGEHIHYWNLSSSDHLEQPFSSVLISKFVNKMKEHNSKTVCIRVLAVCLNRIDTESGMLHYLLSDSSAQGCA